MVKKYIKKNKGSVLAFSLIILSVVLVASLSVVAVALKGRRASIGSDKSAIAYQNAEKGMEMAMKKILKEGKNLATDVDNTLGLCSGWFEDVAAGYKVELLGLDFNGNRVRIDDVSINCNNTTPIETIKYARSIGTSGGYQRAIEAPVPWVKILQVSAGANHSLALDEGGFVWAWGLNASGQLGQGTSGAGTEKKYPVKVKNDSGNGFLSDIVHISASGNFSLAADKNGNVWAWGDNDSLNTNELGVGIANIAVVLPTQVKTAATPLGLAGAVADPSKFRVAACQDSSLALDDAGNVWSWGRDNSLFELGRGGAVSFAARVEIDAAGSILGGIVEIACGKDAGYALDGSKNVWSWGSDQFGQMGNGSVLISNQKFAAQHPTLANITAIDASENSAMALDVNGKVQAWGDNAYKQLGVGNSTSPVESPQFVKDSSGVDISDIGFIAVGHYNSVVVNNNPTNGKVFAAGRRKNKFFKGANCSISADYYYMNEIKDASDGSLSGILKAEVSERPSQSAFIIDSQKKLKAWGERANYVLGDGINTPCQGFPSDVLF